MSRTSWKFGRSSQPVGYRGSDPHGSVAAGGGLGGDEAGGDHRHHRYRPGGGGLSRPDAGPGREAELVARPVSRLVNHVRDDGVELLEPPAEYQLDLLA